MPRLRPDERWNATGLPPVDARSEPAVLVRVGVGLESEGGEVKRIKQCRGFQLIFAIEFD